MTTPSKEAIARKIRDKLFKPCNRCPEEWDENDEMLNFTQSAIEEAYDKGYEDCRAALKSESRAPHPQGWTTLKEIENWILNNVPKSVGRTHILQIVGGAILASRKSPAIKEATKAIESNRNYWIGEARARANDLAASRAAQPQGQCTCYTYVDGDTDPDCPIHKVKEDEKCEGCGSPATTFDSEGVPLCEECSKLPSQIQEWECPECKTRYIKNIGKCGDLTGCSRPNVVPVAAQPQEWTHDLVFHLLYDKDYSRKGHTNIQAVVAAHNATLKP